jgi:hypothetical protein
VVKDEDEFDDVKWYYCILQRHGAEYESDGVRSIDYWELQL